MNNKEFKLDKDMEQFINQFSLISPTQIVNFDINDKFHIIGMYLVCLKDSDLEDIMGCDLSELKGDSYLISDKRNFMEKVQIIDGVLCALITNNSITLNNKDNIIEWFLSNGIEGLKFKKLSKYIDELISDLKLKNSNLINVLKYILKHIWFMPYSKYDYILNLIVKEYDKNSEGDKNNE